MSERFLVWNSLFVGGLFMLGIGARDLGTDGFHRAGVGLIAIGSTVGVVSFFGMRRERKGGKG